MSLAGGTTGIDYDSVLDCDREQQRRKALVSKRDSECIHNIYTLYVLAFQLQYFSQPLFLLQSKGCFPIRRGQRTYSREGRCRGTARGRARSQVLKYGPEGPSDNSVPRYTSHFVLRD